jgi:hypothetical protein
MLIAVALALLVVVTPVNAGKERLNWAIVDKLTVLVGGAWFQGDLDMGTHDITSAGAVAADSVQAGQVTAPIVMATAVASADVTADRVTADYLVGRSVMLRYQDVKDDTGGNVFTAAEITAGTTVITESLTSPDYPRNVVVVLASAAQRAAGTVQIDGITPLGVADFESLTMTAITDTQTLTGSRPWATITSITIPEQTGAITMTVSLGKKFGVGKALVAGADVFAVLQNGAVVAATVVPEVGSVEVSGVTANDDLTIWYKE